MKVMLILAVFLGMIVVAVYYGGGYATFDASQQGKDAMAALKPGMTFTQACDITGNPKKFRIINRKVTRVGGEEIVEMVPTPLIKCTRERIEEKLAEGSLPWGFLCRFDYSASVAFTVEYDDTGVVKRVSDAPTFSDLLDY